MKYNFPLNFRRQLHRRAYKAQQDGHYEVAGTVILKKDRMELVFCKNHCVEPYRFLLDMNEVRRVAKGNKYGNFHSHPISEPYPGKGDLRGAHNNELMLIYDVCGRQAKLWRIVKRGKKKKANLLRYWNTGFHD